MNLDGVSLGTYDVGPELGRGGMGVVYRAVTTADGPAGPAGTEVALKVFRPELREDEQALAAFQREAEIGKEIRHERLVRTYDFGHATHGSDDYDFMVLEVVEGQTLTRLVAELGTVPEHLLFQISDQVLGALGAMHERGVVHRDVKPENVVITPDHRVVLMDLGVAQREGAREVTAPGEFIGSLSYAPPEQIAGEVVGPRADLYAFGMMLYELAAGKHPYDGVETGVVVRRKMDEDVPSPRELNPDLAPFWEAVILTCVQRGVADRFPSAAELRRVLAAGEDSVWWHQRQGDPRRPSAEHALRRLKQDRVAPLIGRNAELEVLGAAHAGAHDSRGVLLLTGPSGIGKSRLLVEFIQRVAGAGGPSVAAGRGVGAGGRGYGPIVEILGDLLAPAGLAKDERKALLEARVEQCLAQTPGLVAPFVEFVLGNLQPGPESGLSRDGLHAAVLAVLRAAAEERPLLLAVEDLHLAGTESIELFEHIAQGAADRPIFLVGVVATDGLDRDGPLAQLLARAEEGGEPQVLVVPPLSPDDTAELVRFVVGHERTVSQIARPLYLKSEGNPLVVLEVIDHLRRNDVLTPRDAGLDLSGSLDEVTLPASVRDVVALKLAALDEEGRETLEAASVLGIEFPASLLAEVLEEESMELLKRLARFERQDRLLVSSGKDTFRFASPQLYDAVYEAIPETLRAEYHDLIADTLLEEDGEPSGRRAYEVLRHLLLAERAPEAAPFLEAALEALSQNFHASFAAPFLEKVAEGFASAEAEARFLISMKLWAFHELRANREDQMRVLDVAQAMAEDMGTPGPRARVHALRAGSWWYAGDYDKAEAEAQAGLALAQDAGDRRWESTCMHTLGVVAFRRGQLEACHDLWRQALEIRREIGDRRGQASTLQALSLVMPAVGQADGVLETMQEALGMWRELGERRGEASMLMNIGNHLVDAAAYEDGLEHLEQAIARHRETGALANEALTLVNLGRAQNLVGRIDDAKASWARALDIFADHGNPNSELAARVMLGSALTTYGEFREARTHLEAAVELADRTGIRSQLVEAHRELGDLFHEMGDAERGWEHMERALVLEDEVKDPTSRVQTLGLMGKAALATGDAARAVRYLEGAVEPPLDGGAYAPLLLARLARAYRDTGEDEQATARAKEAAERLAATTHVSQADGPEICYTLWEILPEDPERQDFLDRARGIVEERSSHIRNDSYRDHYRTRRWPNALVLGETPNASGGNA